jgi:probable phosphoglycerate mutase
MADEVNVYLVRHGEAAASWSEAKDPDLSRHGLSQAAAVCAEFLAGPAMKLVSSPLARARQTAIPIGEAWEVEVAIDDRVRELPSSVPMAERAEWLRRTMRSSWNEVDDALVAWREDAWRAIFEFDHDTIVFTHFMVINAMVGRVCADRRLICFEPDYCSITHLAISGDRASLVELGTERGTVVL